MTSILKALPKKSCLSICTDTVTDTVGIVVMLEKTIQQHCGTFDTSRKLNKSHCPCRDNSYLQEIIHFRHMCSKLNEIFTGQSFTCPGQLHVGKSSVTLKQLFCRFLVLENRTVM